MSAAQSLFQKSTPTGGMWHSLNRVLVTFIILTIAVLVACRFTPELTKVRDQQVRLAQLKAAVEDERQRLARLTREEELLRHDPEYAGTIARDRLDLMKEGETIYRLEPSLAEQAKVRVNRK